MEHSEAAISWSPNDHCNCNKVVDSFEANSAHCVALAQKGFRSDGVKGDLAYLLTHFSMIPEVIEKLQCSNLTLMSAIQKVEDLRKAVADIPGPKGKIVSKKFESVLDKNKSYQVLSEVSQASYKYAPIASCDVEQSF